MPLCGLRHRCCLRVISWGAARAMRRWSIRRRTWGDAGVSAAADGRSVARAWASSPAMFRPLRIGYRDGGTDLHAVALLARTRCLHGRVTACVRARNGGADDQGMVDDWRTLVRNLVIEAAGLVSGKGVVRAFAARRVVHLPRRTRGTRGGAAGGQARGRRAGAGDRVRRTARRGARPHPARHARRDMPVVQHRRPGLSVRAAAARSFAVIVPGPPVDRATFGSGDVRCPRGRLPLAEQRRARQRPTPCPRWDAC